MTDYHCTNYCIPPPSYLHTRTKLLRKAPGSLLSPVKGRQLLRAFKLWWSCLTTVVVERPPLQVNTKNQFDPNPSCPTILPPPPTPLNQMHCYVKIPGKKFLQCGIKICRTFLVHITGEKGKYWPKCAGCKF